MAKPNPDQPTPKRTSPVPSPETEALRAMRSLRKYRKRADDAFRDYQEIRDNCLELSITLESSLSPAALGLVRKVAPELLTSDEPEGAMGE